ncbi:MAG: hypothetical protein U0822_28100 [Anaerolineae bacterium]
MWLRMIGVGMLIALLALLLASCGPTDSDRIHSNDASGTFRTPPAVSASGQDSRSGNGSGAAGSEQGGQTGGGEQTGESQGSGPAPCPTSVQLASGGNPAATPVGCSTVMPVNAVATP